MIEADRAEQVGPGSTDASAPLAAGRRVNVLAGVHVAAFWFAAALCAALLAIAAHGVVTGRRHALALDRVLLAYFLSLAVAALGGLVLLLIGAGPADPLHLLYGAAAPVVVAVARWRAATAAPRRAAAWLAGGAVIALGVLLRLWTTG